MVPLWNALRRGRLGQKGGVPLFPHIALTPHQAVALGGFWRGIEGKHRKSENTFAIPFPYLDNDKSHRS